MASICLGLINVLTKVFCIFGPNLTILAWTGPELSPRQASDWHTHTHRCRRWQYPKAKTDLGKKNVTQAFSTNSQNFMAWIVEFLPVDNKDLFLLHTLVADVLATQGARASTVGSIDLIILEYLKFQHQKS